MIVTMHQPNYLPWIGFFSKIAHSDCLIITDILQYTRHSVTNRNKVRTAEGSCYLTVPINKKFHGSRICDVPLPVDKTWQERHWRSIIHHYSKTRYFANYQDFFEKLYRKDFEYIWQINEEIILYLIQCFEIGTKVIKSSNMNVAPELEKTDLMIAMLEIVGADIYLSGPSGRDYLEQEKFPQHNIGLKFFKFQHPVYSQRYPGFQPNMAAIDLLFNMGPQASEIIRSSGGIEE